MALFDFLSKLLQPDQKKEVKKDSGTEGFDVAEYNRSNQLFIDDFNRKYDLSTKEGIRSIPKTAGAKYHKETEWNAVIAPEAILSKKATEYKKAGRMDMAIECLRKSNELKQVSVFAYADKDYLRLATYLRNNGQFDEARQVESEIEKLFGIQRNDSSDSGNGAAMELIKQGAKAAGTDLVEASWVCACCEKCGKYRGRIFSVSGKSRKYPPIPGDFHFDCGISLFNFYDGISSPLRLSKKQLTGPFVDGRTSEEKAAYTQNLKKAKEDADAKREFEWIQEHLPELAPKSRSGYRRMKNSRSANFLKIQAAAKEKGFEII